MRNPELPRDALPHRVARQESFERTIERPELVREAAKLARRIHARYIAFGTLHAAAAGTLSREQK